MMINKLKALYTKKGIAQKEMATLYNMSPASFNNKMRSCASRFSIEDMILFADRCDLKIAFIDENNNVVETLTKEDIKK